MLAKLGMPLVFIFIVVAFFKPIYGIAFYLAFDFFNPEFYVPGYLDRHMNSILTCFLFAAVIFHRRDNPSPRFLIVLLCFCIAIVLSTLINGLDTTQTQPLFGQVRLAKCIMLALILTAYIRTRKEYFIVQGAVIFALLCNAVFAIMQAWFGYDTPHTADVSWGPVRYGGFFNDPNAAGSFQIIYMLPMAYYLFQHATRRSRRMLWAGLLSLGVLAVFLTISRSNLIGLLVFGGCVLLKDMRKISVLIIAGVLIWGIASFAGEKWHRETLHTTADGEMVLDSSSGARLDIWKDGLRIFIRNPLLGVGPGKFRTAVRELKGLPAHARVLTPHNTPVGALTELGLLGFIPFVCLPIMAWRSLGRLMRSKAPFYSEYAAYYRAGLLGFLFCSMFSGMHASPEAWVVVVLPLVLEKIYTLETETSRPRS